MLPFNSAGHPFLGPTFRGYFGHFRTLNVELLLIVPKTDVLLLQKETDVLLAILADRMLVGTILRKYGSKNSVFGHFGCHTCM